MATATPERGGLRGRLDRMMKEHLEKAAALKVVIEALDVDDRQNAQATAPKKFLQAINHRDSMNGAEPEWPKRQKQKKPVPRQSAAERRAQIAAFLSKHPESTVEEIGDGINLHHNRVRTLLDGFAKPVELGGRTGWVLKGAKTTKRRKKNAPKMSAAVRSNMIEKFLAKHPEATTSEVAEAIGLNAGGTGRLLLRIAKALPREHATETYRWVLKSRAKKSAAKATPKSAKKKHRRTHDAAISGKRLTLFLLEHLKDDTTRTSTDLARDLSDAGAPVKSLLSLNGPLNGALVRNGLAKRQDGGFVRTARGVSFVATLRAALEGKGEVAAGGYTA